MRPGEVLADDRIDRDGQVGMLRGPERAAQQYLVSSETHRGGSASAAPSAAGLLLVHAEDLAVSPLALCRSLGRLGLRRRR
jgi:hypothetical protein